MSFIDLFKEFHSDATEREFPPSARTMYDQLLYEFNARYWQEEILMSERELSRLSGLTVATTHRAVQFLCENGYIKTKKAKHGTIFKLTSDKVPNREAIVKQSWSDSEAIVEQKRSNSEAEVEQQRSDFGNSNIRTRKDVEDFKDLEDLKDKDIIHSINQTERAHAFNWNVEIEEKLTALWLDNCGAGVTIELLSHLRYIVEKHGVLFAEELIREMAGSLKGDRMTLNYLRGCYKRKVEGGSTNVRVAQQSRNNRPNVLAFVDGRTASDFGTASTSGKGRFDDDEIDYSWLYKGNGGD